MSREIDVGFASVVQGVRSVVFRDEGGEQIRAALLNGDACVPASTEGRGTVLRFPYLDGHGLLRKYQRGGAIRFLLKDRYLLHNRPLRELRLHAYLYDKGFRVPKPLGVAWERRGICFTGAIATREVPSVNLQQYLRSQPASEDEVLRQCGRLIRAMHDLGVFHADLQIRNILVAPDGPLIIDFDNAALYEKLGRWRRSMNLLRLRRSFAKNGISLHCFDLLGEGYGGLDIPWILDGLYRIRGTLSGGL